MYFSNNSVACLKVNLALVSLQFHESYRFVSLKYTKSYNNIKYIHYYPTQLDELRDEMSDAVRAARRVPQLEEKLRACVDNKELEIRKLTTMQETKVADLERKLLRGTNAINDKKRLVQEVKQLKQQLRK